jgi:tRNA modification GTPase
MMTVLAAVMTGPGAGAIATIQLTGDSVPTLLQQAFVPAGGKPAVFETGRILVGRFVDDGRTVDQVTIGCEAPRTFCLHCHGNPLIVEAIVKSLRGLGAEIVAPARMLLAQWEGAEPDHALASEARLALATVKTIEGAVLIDHQVRDGLAAKATQWLNSISLETIRREVSQVLADSRTARLIIEGCTIALIGPPNTGKSTLFNALAGREKAIVADVAGTTRDWVSTDIRIPPLTATLIDTAGLDSSPALAEGEIAQAAQRKSIEMLRQADLILLVLDSSRPNDQVSAGMFEALQGKPTVVVLNKTDLPARFSAIDLPDPLQEVVRISAAQGTGLPDLIAAIHVTSGVADFDLGSFVAFTQRQCAVLERLSSAGSLEQAHGLTAELLGGSADSEGR